MMRTVVSNKNDALDILFEAAQYEAGVQDGPDTIGRETTTSTSIVNEYLSRVSKPE
jgi:hypothetical protein